ncbi:MAG: tetratricopeptide repeat protein [Gammaproteobacteria bacterium]
MADPAQAAALLREDARWAERSGLREKAVLEYRKLIELCPTDLDAHNRLAVLLLSLGRTADALAAARSAHALDPDDVTASASLGKALLLAGNFADGQPQAQLALAREPGRHDLRAVLARTLLDQNQTNEAVAVFREGEQQFPADPVLLGILAPLYQRAGLPEDAERCYLALLTLDPRAEKPYADLAQLCIDRALFNRALDIAQRGLAIAPDSMTLWNSVANSQASLGLGELAFASYRRVLELAPGFASAHSNFLLAMHYPSGINPREIFEEHRRWAERHTPASLATTSFPNTRDPGRRLRLGYLSPDIRRHSVAFFLEPLLEHHDAGRFELYCYADVKTPDSTTERLKARFDHFRSVTGMTDRDIVAMIRNDGIDLLVDLAGHAGNTHLAVLGHKPAPVQVTYLGYPDTTGIEAVDYRLSDALADPPGVEDRYTEQLVRLPDGFLCFQPPAERPAIGPPPALARGTVTFGSFNREFKVSQQTLDLWCRILAAVPGSRILMKSIAGNDPATREHQLAEFERRGIARDRVQLVGFIASQAGHLASYRDVDIALDTFPYHGTTTTLDSLLMGVPVITLAGYHHASRVGVSLLTRVGLPELIAGSDDDYVAKAVALAGDLPRLTTLHAALRERLLASPLCDGPGFTRHYEAALVAMWEHWCQEQAGTTG